MPVQLAYDGFYVDIRGELSPCYTVEGLFRCRLGQSDILEPFGLAKQLTTDQQPVRKDERMTHPLELLPAGSRWNSLDENLPLSRRYLHSQWLLHNVILAERSIQAFRLSVLGSLFLALLCDNPA